MAKTITKITLSSSRDIPLNQLVLSQANVRRVKAGLSIEELAEDIARRGLLQGLTVRPVLDADSAETGMYEVPAGGRRFRALERLVKQKRLAKTAPVPCVVRGAASDILAEDDSLAENLQRAPLHPLDQFRAFQTLRAKGMGEEEIAAAFFVSPAVVRQRLRLAAVSDALLDVYAEDGMTLDQLIAFTVSDDHARQEQVWEALASTWSKEPYQIRRMLTESTIRASDNRARFVGIEAYEQAGGVVLRDLFQSDDGGYLQDAALLDRLVNEKLKRAAATVAAEGWLWVEAAVHLPYDHAYGLRQVTGTPVDVSEADQAAIDALNAEHVQLEAAYEDADELPEAVDARLGEIEAALNALQERPLDYDSADRARAGAFVTLRADGMLAVERGYVRPQDEARQDEPDHGVGGAGREDGGSDEGQAATGNGAPDVEDEDEGALRKLPERLVLELSAHRTLALRDAVASQPQVALTALLHKLVSDAFVHGTAAAGCLEASVRPVRIPAEEAGLKTSAATVAIGARHQAWRADLPHEDAALWGWLERLDDASRLALLAHCVSFGVNALVEKVDRYGSLTLNDLAKRLTQADRLAQTVGLDMAEAGWTPTVDNYLGRVPKARILDAVREAKGQASAALLEHLKKAEMAQEAERLLAGTGWLPEALRGTRYAADSHAAAEPEGSDLPAFLTSESGADSAPQPIAAE